MNKLIRQRVFNEIRQSIRNNIVDKNPSVDTKPGTFVSDVFVCPPADELAAFYVDLKIMEINQSINLATGYDLDRLGYNYFTYRQHASTATGRIRFYIAGTNRTTVTLNMVPETIYIPAGFQIATSGNAVERQVVFRTTSSIYISNRDIVNNLSTDTSTGYRYVEVEIECIESGSIGNVAANTITEFYGETINGIASVSNPIACSGGENQESDVSLRMRIMLAVLGASICTKNGYLKFIITRDHVLDAIVVGGADDIMFRDGGYIDSSGTYQYGRGGMVDIWVRGKNLEEITTTFDISSTYLMTSDDIVLENQPVVNVVSIVSALSGYIYENADNYEIEYGVADNVVTQTYYRDILWDFSITDTFTDTEFYPMDIVDTTEIEMLRRQVNSELQSALDYMENIDYSINWSLTTLEDISTYDVTPMFRKVFYNNKTYKIIAVDNRLNGRTFVKKNNRIYLRVYQEPDYVVVPTTYSDERYTSQLGEDVGGSILSQDCIHWTEKGKELLQEGDILTITYNYNRLILDLQTEMNNKRILTADILLRQAYEVPLQILMEVHCDERYNSNTLKSTINTIISTFVNSLKSMGSSIEDSEIVTLARTVQGVTHVDLDSVKISRKGKAAESIIKLASNEYLSLDNLDIKMIQDSSVES